MESLEGGVPMLVTPLTLTDQMSNCKLIQKYKYGYCLGKFSFLMLEEAVSLIEKNNYFQEELQRIVKVIKRKKEEPIDAIYWIKYLMEVGTEHLVPKDTIHMNYFQLKDLDIHLALYLIIICILWIVYNLLVRCWRCACRAKKDNINQ